MHIVFAGDRQIAKPVAVAAASISRVCSTDSRGRGHVQLTIVGVGWTDQDLDFVVRAAPNVRVQYKSVEHLELPKVRKGRHVTSAAYLTLYLPELFPDEDRILYLDHDVLVRDDRIWDLWNTNIDRVTLSACRAVSIPRIGSRNGILSWRQLGLDPQALMFNSGVMMINVSQCRILSITKCAVDFALSNSTETTLADQHALNCAVNGNWTQVPPIFNAGTKLLSDHSGAYAVHEAKFMDEAKTNPCIVHFIGRDKPWNPGTQGPYFDDWRSLSRELGWTPWEKRRPVGNISVRYFKQILKRVLQKKE